MKSIVTKEGKVHLNERWFFLRDANDFPVACIASRLKNLDGKEVQYAVSIHNPLDTFNRARGRDIALARLNKQRPEGWHTVDLKGAKDSILQKLADDKTLPIRVREAAKHRIRVRWLFDKPWLITSKD